MVDMVIRVSRYIVANVIANALLHLALGIKFSPIWIVVGFIDPLSWIGAAMLVWGWRYFTVSTKEVDEG
ncbi:hypothetical protein [Phyllobacterium endophyticum]|uniref:hypothetical protein n=1 Tax=Phyllobacterium endophyticum TaxID=1149773 RepID=UPI0011C78D7E|nr:hypothetical protein [Phyllobacterium endophyticum]TXR49883.1 hypothetical protein FVA77_07670 [Phyllobacterium endophyticum]